MMLPISASLFPCYFQLIPAMSTLYHLEILPYKTKNKMRFLIEAECGCAGILLLLSQMILHRLIERYTDRKCFCAMEEHVSAKEERRLFRKLQLKFLEWGERIWDAIFLWPCRKCSFCPDGTVKAILNFLENSRMQGAPMFSLAVQALALACHFSL